MGRRRSVQLGSTVVAAALLSAALICWRSYGEEGPRISLNDRVSITGLVEIEAFVEDVDGETNSDVTLATVQVGISAEINEMLSADIVLLWEEDDTEPVDLDEGYITGSFGEWTIRAGKLYVPFGSFESHFVSDPMTLEVGETRETALSISYAYDPLEVSIAAYNGDVAIRGGNDNSINNVVAAVQVSPSDNLTFGVSWTRNIADSDGLEEEFLSPIEIDEAVPGFGGFASFSIDKFTLEMEYVGVLDDFEDAELDSDGDGNGDKPITFNAEIAYAIRENMEAAVRYEMSDEFLNFPESRYGACLSWGAFKYTTLSFELLHAVFDDDIVEDDATTFTTQLAVEF